MHVHLTQVSSNTKTGPIPVSTTERRSCPPRCPHMDAGCYADGGPLRIHWDKVPERGTSWEEFCERIAQLPAGALWRHNQAGDLPGDGTRIAHRVRFAGLLKPLLVLIVGQQLKRGLPVTLHQLKQLAESVQAQEHAGRPPSGAG